MFLFFNFFGWFLVTGSRIFSRSMWTLSYCMWGLVPWPGIKLPLQWGTGVLATGPSEISLFVFKSSKCLCLWVFAQCFCINIPILTLSSSWNPTRKSALTLYLKARQLAAGWSFPWVCLIYRTILFRNPTVLCHTFLCMVEINFWLVFIFTSMLNHFMTF